MPRPRSPHGSAGGYRGHKERRERVCDQCQAFHDTQLATKKAQRALDAETGPLNPRQKAKHVAEIDARELKDAAASLAKLGFTRRGAKNDRPAGFERLDPLAETLANLHDVEDAIEVALREAIPSVAALSKRRSELLREMAEYGGVEKVEGEEDPLKDRLGAGIDMSNVTPLRAHG